MLKLSKYFTLEEFTVSETAARYGINNRPGPGMLGTLIYTAEQLDKVRELLGQPILVNSAFRCDELNTKIGSKSSSQHTKGQAVDFICPKFGTPKHIVETIFKSTIVFDQLILEFDSWVHISFVNTNSRKQVLIIDSKGTRLFK